MCKFNLSGLFFAFVMLSSGVFSNPTQNRLKIDDDYEETLSVNNECNCVCGVSNRHMRVVGGNITKVHEFPWIVGLSNNGEFYCGATVITRRHLLTAAHCFHGIDIKKVRATFGDHHHFDENRLEKIQIRSIKSVTMHKFYESSSYNNDIAILELNKPVIFNERVQPACLPNSAQIDYSKSLAIVAGWGLTGEKENTSSVLRKAVVPVWTKEECYKSDYGEHRLSENMFCAGYAEGNIDACQGDSGGPLQVKTQYGNMEVIGVVSWGRGCARPNLPGIYTKLVNYLDFVQEAIEGECLCPPPSFNSRRA